MGRSPMTDNETSSTVDPVTRDGADPIHRSAMAFLLSRGSQPAPTTSTPTEMMRFAEELVSLSLAFVTSDASRTASSGP